MKGGIGELPTYIITGVDRQGKRFKITTCSAEHALGINVWQGSKWKLVNGKRKLLCRV